MRIDVNSEEYIMTEVGLGEGNGVVGSNLHYTFHEFEETALEGERLCDVVEQYWSYEGGIDAIESLVLALDCEGIVTEANAQAFAKAVNVAVKSVAENT